VVDVYHPDEVAQRPDLLERAEALAVKLTASGKQPLRYQEKN